MPWGFREELREGGQSASAIEQRYKKKNNNNHKRRKGLPNWMR